MGLEKALAIWIGCGIAAWGMGEEKKEAPVQNGPAAIEAATQWVLYPKDIEASKIFYTDQLGFSLAYPFGGGPVKGYQLKAGEVGLTLLSIQGAPVTKAEQVMLHLKVSDVDAYRKLLGERKVPIVKEVEDTDWGTRWFHVKDPDGLTLAFERRKETGQAEPRSEEWRKLGSARLEVPGKAKSREEWKRLWKDPKHAYPFKLGDCWTHCVEYAVSDFPAEVGFWIDGIGLEANAIGPDFAMFTSPKREFFLSVVPATKVRAATGAEDVRLEFMIQDLPRVGPDLERRGIRFERKPTPEGEGSPLWKGTFRTPNGIAVDLWSMVDGEAGAK